MLLVLIQVIELIKRTPKESPTGDYTPESGTLQGALALVNVVFSYPIRPTHKVLNGLSMAVNPGGFEVFHGKHMHLPQHVGQ